MSAPIAHHMFFDTEATAPPMPLWEGLALDYPDNAPGFQWARLATMPQAALPVCAAWALNDGPVQSSTDPLVFARDLFRARKDGRTVLVAHNAEYDVTLMWLWLARLNDAAARMFSHYVPGFGLGNQIKPWNVHVIDTMVLRYVKLTTLAEAHGVDAKASGVNGGDVVRMVAEGRIDEVRAYCEGDVEDARRVFLRMCDTWHGFEKPAWAKPPESEA